MSDRERSESRSGSNHSGVNNSREDKKSKSRSRSREPSKSNHKSRRSRSRSPRKMSYKGSRYRSRSRSPRRRSRRSYSRSRSRSYTPRSKRRSSSHSPMSSRRRHLGSRENPQPCRCLGIFGLSVYTTEQDLHHVFSKYGPVERVQVVIDAKTGRSRGFAFCYFENLEDAKVAKEQCSGMEMDGRHIRVDYSITPRAHTPTPGIYMGKPTYGRDRDYNRYDRRDRDDYYGGYRSSYRRSPSPYYRRSRRYDRSRSRSYSPRIIAVEEECEDCENSCSTADQLSKFGNVRMSIGILVVALLMVTMPGKCKIDEKKLQSPENLTIAPTVWETETDFANMTTEYEITPRTTTMTIPSNGVTVFGFANVNRVPVAGKLAGNKANLENAIWPVKHAAEMVGDLILGGLMMVHEREDSVTCGPIMPQGGIQALETMLYTLDVINNMGLLPNVTVGAHILDDCDKDTYGLEMAVDFIKVPRSFDEDVENEHQVDYDDRDNEDDDDNEGSVQEDRVMRKSAIEYDSELKFPQRRHRHKHGEPAHDFFRTNHDRGLLEVENLISEVSWSKEKHLDIHWPVKKEAVVEGDLILGGLMMVHEREDSVTCGPVMPQGGVQAVETMLYTLDVINNGTLLPNIRLGAHILDDCDKDTYGLEMAVDFIKGSISNIDGAEYSCNKTHVRKVISGVVGAASSVTSIQVANLLRLFRIPQVSFFSTSPELSNKQRFEYFSRTIPSDHYQVKVMVEIVRLLGWSYVSIIYEESNYGIKAFEELEDLFGKYNVCIAVKERLVKDSGVADETAYDHIVHKLLTKPRARGAIIFGSDQEVAGVMRAVRRCNATGSFSWIGSDGWSARSLVSDGNEPEVEGTLSVQPQANPVKGFEEYFLSLTVENNKRNPWFVEFWEDHFHCKYPNSSRTPYNVKYKKTCTTKERLTKSNTVFEAQLQFVSDSVMAFAHAFKDMHKDLCDGKPGLCGALKPIKGTELLKYLRKIKFTGLSGDEFHFDPNGDGPARYNIIHFKQVAPSEYRWVRVGQYLEGELQLNMSEIQFKLGQPHPPESVCSLPCSTGQAKKYVEGESCCWHCFNCTQYQIRHSQDETQCENCPMGTTPNELKTVCVEIPEQFLRPESGWAIGAMSFSSTGILVTLFVVGIFVKHSDTPVVRASGRELSYVLLSGILLCYLVTFALVLRPTDIVCGIQRFGAGFCFTVVYAALLTKTNRISRIFNAGKRTAKRPSFISPRSQIIICSGLVGVQVLINGVWIAVSPPRAVHHYPTRDDNHLVCSSHIDASYMIAFGYPIILIIICTVYAVLTRKIPEAFNESKHIGFTMYTTCVIWLAFVPLYFGTSNHVPLRITSMAVTISLSASVTLACLFSPKLYIILVHPERNIRQSMMPARHSMAKNVALTGTSHSLIGPAAAIVQNIPHTQTSSLSVKLVRVDESTQSDGYDFQLDRKPNVNSSNQSTQTFNNNCETKEAQTLCNSILSDMMPQPQGEKIVNDSKLISCMVGKINHCNPLKTETLPANQSAM